MEERKDDTTNASPVPTGNERGCRTGKRSSYADMGLTIAIGIFVCLLVKSLLFGFTWGSIAGLVVAAVYFVVSALFDSRSSIVRHSTTALLALSVLVAVAVAVFDKNAQPKMHAFEGTNDTIQDVRGVEYELTAPIVEFRPDSMAPADSIGIDSIVEAVFIDDAEGIGEQELTDSI